MKIQRYFKKCFCLATLFVPGFFLFALSRPAQAQQSFQLPNYYYRCNQIQLYFPTDTNFIKTSEAKNILNRELDAVFSNGENGKAQIPIAYQNLINAIADDLSTAPKNSDTIEIIINFEKALGSIEECGRALNLWPEISSQIRRAFQNYYLQSKSVLSAKISINCAKPL